LFGRFKTCGFEGKETVEMEICAKDSVVFVSVFRSADRTLDGILNIGRLTNWIPACAGMTKYRQVMDRHRQYGRSGRNGRLNE
jgi:hypothetical protein